MKSAFNYFTCLGFLLFIGGGFLVTAGLMGGWGLITLGIGVVVLFFGLILIFLQFKIAGRWNKVVDVFNSHEIITIHDASDMSGVTSEGVRNIIYEAIASGDLSGTLDGDTFSRVKGTVSTTTTETVKVLVVCPFCGAKTEQGLAKCQKCGADL